MTAATTQSEAVLLVTGLTASFGKESERNTVLNDISFRLKRGATLGIVGESGSGKSVTSMSIMRLIDSPPISYDNGQIIYGQEQVDLLSASEEQLSTLRGRRIGMVFQEPMSSLNPVHRCGEQVAEALMLHTALDSTQRRAKVISLFEEVMLPDPERIYRAYPHELSGGQKQRVMIAMAMSCEPELLICDEPTTALDVTVQREILDLLDSLQKRTGMAMIFISHDLGVVAHIADEIAVMHRGVIVEQGPSSDIMHRATHPYTQGLLACRPPDSGRPHRLVTVTDIMSGGVLDSTSESSAARSDRLKTLYSQAPLIKIRGLKTWYPVKKGLLMRTVDHVKAVDGVDFDLFAGESLGLVGESGCGKSTLGRTLVGLERASGGHIDYRGQDLVALSQKALKDYRRRVQIIFQDPFSSLDPKCRIGEAIAEPMLVHGLVSGRAAARSAVGDLLERVGMSADHYERYPHEFSGGQRQRISIARTLSLAPEVVICDESVSALDVSVQAQVLNLLNDLKEDLGLTYLFISHDLSVVRYFSDRVMVMRGGRIEEIAEADSLYAQPKSDYSRQLIASTIGH